MSLYTITADELDKELLGGSGCTIHFNYEEWATEQLLKAFKRYIGRRHRGTAWYMGMLGGLV